MCIRFRVNLASKQTNKPPWSEEVAGIKTMVQPERTTSPEQVDIEMLETKREIQMFEHVRGSDKQTKGTPKGR